MNKYWRFGLVLLVAVAACSDKKAEQATALKAESAPMNLPTGVRAPASMTASAIGVSFQKSVAGR